MTANRNRPGSTAHEASDEGQGSAEVEAMLAMVRSRLGRQWEAVDHDQVAAAIERQRGLADAMRRVPLANSDEPDLIFIPRSSHDRDG